VLSFSSLVPLLGVFLYLFFYFILGRSANFHLDYSPKVSNLMVPIGLMLNSLTLLMILTVFSFTGEFLPICDLKNMVSTSTKDFS
jgi:hypothetical protein